MKYAIANFDPTTGNVDTDSIVWKDSCIEKAKDIVHKDKYKCVLFYHNDVPGCGCPMYKEATREEFEANPAVKGVAYYKGWSGYVYE